MESVELCEIVRDEDEQDGSVSQLIWRVESWESWRSTYLIVIHARLIRFVKLETAGYIPVPVVKKKRFPASLCLQHNIQFHAMAGGRRHFN